MFFENLHLELGRQRIGEKPLQALLLRRGIVGHKGAYGDRTYTFQHRDLLRLDLLEYEAIGQPLAGETDVAGIDRQIHFCLERGVKGIALRGLVLKLAPLAADASLICQLLERVGLEVIGGRIAEVDSISGLLLEMEKWLAEAAALATEPEKLRKYLEFTPGPSVEDLRTGLKSHANYPGKIPIEEFLEASGVPIRNGRVPKYRFNQAVQAGLQLDARNWKGEVPGSHELLQWAGTRHAKKPANEAPRHERF